MEKTESRALQRRNYSLPSISGWQNKELVKSHLALMRTNGQVDHMKTLAIPDDQRIPVLVATKGGREAVLTILTAAIGSAFANLNLRVGMDADQIIDLVEAIIDSSHEDYLAIEDVLLFLRDMLTGKAGKIYDRMDMPKFFEMFETYRTARHQIKEQVKEEREAQYKAMGIPERSYEDATAERDKHTRALSEFLYTQDMKKYEKKD